MVETALLAFFADRGHFNFCIPLARALKAQGYNVELWTNELCQAWVPPGVMDVVQPRFGSGEVLSKVIAGYKKAVCHGESDADGREFIVRPAPFQNVAPYIADAGWDFDNATLPAPSEAQAAFAERLAQPDVAVLVYEVVWGKWAGQLAQKIGRPAIGFCPSYLRPFRAASGVPIWEFDGELRLRDRPVDIREEMPQDMDLAFVIADCLRGAARNVCGARCFGAILPGHEEDSEMDVRLRAWLDGEALQEQERGVVVLALGSQSSAEVAASWLLTDVLKGCLAAAPRVLLAAAATPDDEELLAAEGSGRLRAEACLPQWAVLGHGSVRCFLSHCGANSVHEALARGKAIVPLPFADDQYYIAASVERLYGWPSPALRKAMVRAGPGLGVPAVEAAVRLGLAVPPERLRELQQEVLAEDGAGAAAAAVKAKATAS